MSMRRRIDVRIVCLTQAARYTREVPIAGHVPFPVQAEVLLGLYFIPLLFHFAFEYYPRRANQV